MLNQAIYPVCIIFACWLLSVTGHQINVEQKDVSVWNRTKEWMLIEKKKIVKPHLDLYVQDKGILVKSKVYQPPLDDTLNILIDNISIDVTRYENNTCYNIDGKCSSTICSCDIENNIFTSTYHIAFHKTFMTFGFEYRFIREMDKAIIKVCLFKTFDGANFSHPFIQSVTLHSSADDRNEEKIPGTNIIRNTNQVEKLSYETILVVTITCIVCLILCKVNHSKVYWQTDDKLALQELQTKIKLATNCSTNRHKRNEISNVPDRSTPEQLILPNTKLLSKEDVSYIGSLNSDKLSNCEEDTKIEDETSINIHIECESVEKYVTRLYAVL